MIPTPAKDPITIPAIWPPERPELFEEDEVEVEVEVDAAVLPVDVAVLALVVVSGAVMLRQKT